MRFLFANPVHGVLKARLALLRGGVLSLRETERDG